MASNLKRFFASDSAGAVVLGMAALLALVTARRVVCAATN
jgi:hypothetical protein